MFWFINFTSEERFLELSTFKSLNYTNLFYKSFENFKYLKCVSNFPINTWNLLENFGNFPNHQNSFIIQNRAAVWKVGGGVTSSGQARTEDWSDCIFISEIGQRGTVMVMRGPGRQPVVSSCEEIIITTRNSPNQVTYFC